MKIQLNSLFESIDRQDIDAFLAFLSEDAVFRFGNAEPIKGKVSIRDVLHGFFGSIKALHHDVCDSWDVGNASVCHGMVTYTRHDSSTLTVPFSNILMAEGDLISEYLIFVDVSNLHKSA